MLNTSQYAPLPSGVTIRKNLSNLPANLVSSGCCVCFLDFDTLSCLSTSILTPLGGRRKIFQQRVMFISINRRTNCSLHSNTKGRLKIPCGIFQTAFHSGIDYLINQARHPLFSLYSAYWVPKRFCRPLCRWRSYLCPDSPDGAGSSGCS